MLGNIETLKSKNFYSLLIYLHIYRSHRKNFVSFVCSFWTLNVYEINALIMHFFPDAVEHISVHIWSFSPRIVSNLFAFVAGTFDKYELWLGAEVQ